MAENSSVMRLKQKPIFRDAPKHSTEYYLLLGLCHSVAVHHSKLDRDYRLEVERLFVARKLTLIFAAGKNLVLCNFSGTLAQGINMPCKTAVFATFGPQLTISLFQQACGRAGRRGFDAYGNIVFWAVPRSNIENLITGEIGTIHGNFPLTISYILRIILVLDSQKTDEDDIRKLKLGFKKLIYSSFYSDSYHSVTDVCY
jgi:superfamily II RNA helicase